jgi:hypothetical protein
MNPVEEQEGGTRLRRSGDVLDVRRLEIARHSVQAATVEECTVASFARHPFADVDLLEPQPTHVRVRGSRPRDRGVGEIDARYVVALAGQPGGDLSAAAPDVEYRFRGR